MNMFYYTIITYSLIVGIFGIFGLSIDYFNRNMYVKTFGNFIFIIYPKCFKCLFLIARKNVIIKFLPEELKIWKSKGTTELTDNFKKPYVNYYLALILITVWEDIK